VRLNIIHSLAGETYAWGGNLVSNTWLDDERLPQLRQDLIGALRQIKFTDLRPSEVLAMLVVVGPVAERVEHEPIFVKLTLIQ
jgi:hypothetical protein